jgi:oligoendopeptidase F
MAKFQAKKRLEPWDLMAPRLNLTGDAVKYRFAQAREMITTAFSSVEPAMGEFVGMMMENGWVDSRVLPNKRGGAFCTGFKKSRTPRVFQTFLGSYQDVSTLAHELGHAWHSWAMRDLPLAQLHYPMTLAETASIFGENALSDHVFLTAKDDSIRLEIAYAEVSDAVSLLVNIPTRFEFEKSFYEARQRGSLTPKELGDLMEEAFRKWYGDGIGQVERQFWMTKLHFSIAEVSFYNYPYTFGYLFSLGVYAQRKVHGDRFGEIYRSILRDTGRMTAEDLVQKHLGLDIRKPDLWRQSLKTVEEKVARLEAL